MEKRAEGCGCLEMGEGRRKQEARVLMEERKRGREREGWLGRLGMERADILQDGGLGALFIEWGVDVLGFGLGGTRV